MAREFNTVQREKAFDYEAVKTRTQCKQQQTVTLNLYVLSSKTELILDLHTKTFGNKMLGMCKCLRHLFEDCSVAFFNRVLLSQSEDDNVRGAAESEKSCDKNAS